MFDMLNAARDSKAQMTSINVEQVSSNLCWFWEGLCTVEHHIMSLCPHKTRIILLDFAR
jgi:hypothetical protein